MDGEHRRAAAGPGRRTEETAGDGDVECVGHGPRSITAPRLDTAWRGALRWRRGRPVARRRAPDRRSPRPLAARDQVSGVRRAAAAPPRRVRLDQRTLPARRRPVGAAAASAGRHRHHREGAALAAVRRGRVARGRPRDPGRGRARLRLSGALVRRPVARRRGARRTGGWCPATARPRPRPRHSRHRPSRSRRARRSNRRPGPALVPGRATRPDGCLYSRGDRGQSVDRRPRSRPRRVRGRVGPGDAPARRRRRRRAALAPRRPPRREPPRPATDV